mmetsp:Transcript_15017/g.18984  ORF Transcript_15017/g.18984 Transcript_15017/m.18984 type:complete len:180 (-) Transcript_15017:402-941(-)
MLYLAALCTDDVFKSRRFKAIEIGSELLGLLACSVLQQSMHFTDSATMYNLQIAFMTALISLAGINIFHMVATIYYNYQEKKRQKMTTKLNENREQAVLRELKQKAKLQYLEAVNFEHLKALEEEYKSQKSQDFDAAEESKDKTPFSLLKSTTSDSNVEESRPSHTAILMPNINADTDV